MRLRTVVIVVLAVALIVAGAIVSHRQERARGDESETVAATLAALGTVETLQDCPWGDASCVLAVTIERTLNLGNVDAVVTLAEPEFYDCPGRSQQRPGEPFPLCDGAPEFTRLEGYAIARSEGGPAVVDQEGLHAFLRDFVASIEEPASDGAGGGGLRLYAFGCPQRAVPFQNLSCARLAIILSALTSGRDGEIRRELLVFWAVGNFRGRTLPVTEVWRREIAGEEQAIVFESGGFITDLGEIHVIDQSLRHTAD